MVLRRDRVLVITQVGGQIVSGPVLEQRGNGRAEFVEQIAERTALLRVQPNISHAVEVYGRSSLS